MHDEQDPLVSAALVGLAFGCLAVALLLLSFGDQVAVFLCHLTQGRFP